MPKKKKPQPRQPKGPTNRVNDQIRVPEVRLIDEKGEAHGVVSTQEALRRAEEAELDLVEVATDVSPPVCKILNFAKLRYEKERKDRENRAHQRHSQLKELRFRPRIEEHDYQTKVRNLRKFLERGNKVKVTVMFRGREMAYQENGHKLMQRLQEEMDDIAQPEKAPAQEGRFLFVTFAPRSH